MLLACGAEVRGDTVEHQLILRWHKEGKSTAEIAELLQRKHGTVSRRFRKGTTGEARVGRPQGVTPAVCRKLNKALQRLQKRADAEKEVTLPMVIAEAMMRAIPVITTDIAGIPEMLTNGVHGYSLPPGDHPKAEAAALERA